MLNSSRCVPTTGHPGRSGATGFLAILLAGWLGWAAGTPAGAATPSRFLVLAPTSTTPGDPADLVIAISVLDPDGQVDPATVQLWLDGREVTSSAQVTARAVTYVPDPPLSSGAHQFEVRGKTRTGGEVVPVRREFRFGSAPVEESPRETTGQLALETMSDDVTGPGGGLRQEPSRTSTARFTMSSRWNGWKFNGHVFLTSDEDRGYQPRDRFALHVEHGRVGLDAGDMNYAFSPFVLQGKRTRGVGGHARFGAFQVTALGGSIRRPVEGVLRITPDSVHTPADTTASGGTFERRLVGLRLAVGRGRVFQFGLDGLRIRDDAGSIENGLMPKDNLVVGGNIRVVPLGRRLVAEANWAASALTEDITGGTTPDSLLEERVGRYFPDFRPYEDIFVVNFFTAPLDPRGLSSLALETAVSGHAAGHDYRASYRRVGAAFRSLAAPSLQNDKAGYRFSDAFFVLDRHLEMSGDFEGFSDNLSHDNLVTTDTRNWGVTATVLPGRAVFKNVNLGVRSYHRQNDAAAPVADGADRRRDETTTSYTLGTNCHVPLGPGHELALAYAHARTDALAAAADGTQATWSVGWSTVLRSVPLALKASLGGSRTEYPASGADLTYRDLGLGASYRLLGGRLDTSASFARVVGDGSHGLPGGEKLSWSAGAGYRLRAGTSLSGRLGQARFRDDARPERDYDETMLTVRLVQDFSL